MLRVFLRGGCDASASSTYYLLVTVSAVCYSLSFTLNIVYMATTVGLNAFQLVLVGTVLELTCFVLEVPTGIIADLHSRRLSILVGLLLIGVGLGLQGAVPTYWAILTAQVLWGAGATFTSGAIEAWISDEVGTERVAAIFTRGQQLHLAGTVVGVIGAGALSMITIQLPLVVSGAGFLLLTAFLWRSMPEQHFNPASREAPEAFRHLAATARAGLSLARRQPVIRSVLLVSVFVGLSAETFDRLWQLRLLNGFDLPRLPGQPDPFLWFAAIELAGVVIALACSLLINRLGLESLKAAHPHRILAGLAAVQVAGVVALALSGWLWLAVGALWLKASATVLSAPIFSAWINRNLEPQVRATVLSFLGQARALGEITGGPPLGFLARRTSVSVALLGSAVLLLPTVAILAGLRPDRTAAEPAADVTDVADPWPQRPQPPRCDS